MEGKRAFNVIQVISFAGLSIYVDCLDGGYDGSVNETISCFKIKDFSTSPIFYERAHCCLKPVFNFLPKLYYLRA